MTKNELGQFNRKYELNQNYFNIIDTEQKAYFLGFLYADGCNYKNGAIALALQERDKHILETFNKELDTNRPLFFRDLKTKHPKWQNVYRLDIHSQIISRDLIKLGCPPQKTYILTFPNEDQVPKHFIRHFIRGYMDGDGYIGYIKRHNRKCFTVKVSFSSCIFFLEGLQKRIQDELDINCSISKQRKGQNPLCRDLRVNKKYDSIKLLNWLYGDSTIYLNRKHETYRTITVSESKNLEKRSLLG